MTATACEATRARAFVLPGNVASLRVATVAISGNGCQNSGARLATVAKNGGDGWQPLPPKPDKSRRGYGSVPLAFVPDTEDDLAWCLEDPKWRVCSGQLYKIMVKSAVAIEGEEQTIVPFVPNRAQRRLMDRLWHRNIILKARQLGFTTLVCIMWLDHALFNADQRVGIVAQDAPAAEAFFRDKVKLAYDRLPDSLKAARPLERESADELLFSNNSSIRVATSMRSGTIHRLHVSEFGKICAKYPDKAAEVVTGTLPAVPLDGIAIIESTAEGQEGEFFKMTTRAIELAQSGRVLTQKDFRIHFFPWWADPAYVIEQDVPMTDRDREYFAQVEGKTGTTLTRQQRNWYVATRDGEFSGDPEKMWQEYPSFAAEAFQVSTEGTYYANQLAAARKAGRICRVPFLPGVKVNTFWDIGNSDGTAIWLHQRVGHENRWIKFFEGWGEPYSHFIKLLQDYSTSVGGIVWGTHYLPHDAAHKRQQGDRVASPEDMLRELDLGGDWAIVPAVDDILHGIQRVRDEFPSYVFDEEGCKEGLAHLAAYRKTWDKTRGTWKNHQPRKLDGHSEAPDAIRQHAQGYQAPSLAKPPSGSANWRVA